VSHINKEKEFKNTRSHDDGDEELNKVLAISLSEGLMEADETIAILDKKISEYQAKQQTIVNIESYCENDCGKKVTNRV